MARHRRKNSFFKSREKPLPADFARDYVIALRATSKKHKDDPETIKAVKLLKRMSREASLAGRGEVWVPRPGSTTGHYPVIEELPFNKIRTALRKNTLKRQKAWDAVAAATRPFYPQHSAINHMEKSLLPAAMVALPFTKGRTPALLGKRVPGELQMTRSGSSIIPIRSINPDEWEQRGFQPLTFERTLATAVRNRGNEMQYAWRAGFRRFLRKHPNFRGFRRGMRTGAERTLQRQGPIERAIMGKKGETSARRAKEVVRKIAGEGAAKRTQVKKVTGAAYFPTSSRRGRIVIPRNAPVAAHEAGHAVQHKKLGRAFRPIMQGLPLAATPAAFLTARKSAGEDKKKSWRKGTAAGMVPWVPRIALEAAASRRGLKMPGGPRMAAMGTGSYLVGAAGKAAIAAGLGKWVGGMKPPKVEKHELAAEALIYEKGYQYGLRTFLQRHHVGDRLKRGALPAALSGLVLEGLRRAHTEFGISPTTVDLTPVRRTSLKGEFAPYTNMQLSEFRKALLNKIPEVDEATVNEIKKQIGKINVEIIGRRAV